MVVSKWAHFGDGPSFRGSYRHKKQCASVHGCKE